MNDTQEPFRFKLKPAIKTKWLEDLRSGDFEQTQEVLFDGEAYCCLGVLSVQMAKLGACGWREQAVYGMKLFPGMFSEEAISSTDLPLSVVEAITKDPLPLENDIELRSLMVAIPVLYTDLQTVKLSSGRQLPTEAENDITIGYKDHRYITLAVLNDDLYTFAEIADVIEQLL